jgi:hypothetical protein
MSEHQNQNQLPPMMWLSFVPVGKPGNCASSDWMLNTCPESDDGLDRRHAEMAS